MTEIMHEIDVYTGNPSDVAGKVIYQIKEQAPKALDLHGVVDVVNVVNEDKPIEDMSILESICQSRQFKDYMNGYLTNDQNQLFSTLSFNDFDALMNPNHKLTAVKVHTLLYQYTQQLNEICASIDDGITWLVDHNATTRGIEEKLEEELSTNRDVIAIKISFLMFIQELCSWK